MRFFIDTEFNEFQGALISMALVADDGREWYEALPCANPGAWVAANVMPIIGKAPLNSGIELAASLGRFLAQFDNVHIVADWPEDISHFCNALIVGPGQRIDTPPLTFEIDRSLPDTSCVSLVPHNALEDARALSREAMKRESRLTADAEPPLDCGAKCNMELFRKGDCGKPAKWKHERWPNGVYCDEHKEMLARFWPDGWVQCS